MEDEDEPSVKVMASVILNGLTLLIGAPLLGLVISAFTGWSWRTAIWSGALAATGAVMLLARWPIARWRERRLREHLD